MPAVALTFNCRLDTLNCNRRDLPPSRPLSFLEAIPLNGHDSQWFLRNVPINTV